MVFLYILVILEYNLGLFLFYKGLYKGNIRTFIVMYYFLRNLLRFSQVFLLLIIIAVELAYTVSFIYVVVMYSDINSFIYNN